MKRVIFCGLVAAFAISCRRAGTGTAKQHHDTRAATTQAKNQAAKAAAQAPAGTPGSSLANAGGTYTIDPQHAEIVFRIEHHHTSFQYGMFSHVAGTFTIDAKDPANSKVDITVPTASVFTAVKERDDDLKGPDFFDAKQFPQITFKSKKITATGPDTYSVVGALTMHGATHDITLTLKNVAARRWPELFGGGFHVGFNGKATINRSDWNMNAMNGVIGDQVTLLFAVEGTRNQ